MKEKCGNCEGAGWVTEAECCGNQSEHGGCCGSPVPAQAQCEACCGTGVVDVETKIHVPYVEHCPFFKGHRCDGYAYRPGWYGGGWRDSYISTTGIHWGPFQARRNR